MKNNTIIVSLIALTFLVGLFVISHKRPMQETRVPGSEGAISTSTKTALFGGGCFWCVESDFEKLDGVITAISGYAGGTGENPTYENYAEQGQREVVEVTYNPALVSYENLVEYLIKHGDPTDTGGSFYDRGAQYAPAIYYDTDAEWEVARAVVARIDGLHKYTKPVSIVVIPRVKFWSAEEYHQDFYRKNSVKYSYYRASSGRDAFIKAHWGSDTGISVTDVPASLPSTSSSSWSAFRKPTEVQLRAMLTPLQYQVTQEQGTEAPFQNEYDTNHAEGIYVDRISGEPLYDSRDKYDSGTGWPSFVKPISPEAVTLHEDNGFFTTRVEVRSRYADSHLGHVFDDGPLDRGGKRYCMNSAALRFVPKETMAQEGYRAYLNLFE